MRERMKMTTETKTVEVGPAQTEAFAAVQFAYDAATGNFSCADWTHDLKQDGVTLLTEDGYGSPILCDGEEECDTCDKAKAAADAAEEFANEALDAAERGEWVEARDLAKKAAAKEEQFGDAPTWLPFVEAFDKEMTCQCGELTGTRCACDTLLPDHRVTLRYVSPSDQGTAQTLHSTRGLTKPVFVCDSCADDMTEDEDEDLPMVYRV